VRPQHEVEERQVSTLRTPDRVDDSLSFGGDPSPRPPAVHLAAAAAAGLVVGLLAGYNTGVSGLSGPGDDRPSSASPLVAGLVENVDGDRGDMLLQLRVHNAGVEQATVDLLDVGGWVPERSTPAIVSAGAWGVVEFSAPDDCSAPPTGSHTVHLRSRTGTAVSEQTLPLAGGAEKLIEHQEVVCSRTVPLTVTVTLDDGREVEGWLEAWRREPDGWHGCVRYSRGLAGTSVDWFEEGRIRLAAE
jgi:hypothetical protein